MRWLFVLAIVGMAANAQADGCRVTTPSGQVLFVREVSAALPMPHLRLRASTDRPAPADVGGATLGRIITDPLRRRIGIDILDLASPFRPDLPPAASNGRLIVDLELRVDDCAPTDA